MKLGVHRKITLLTKWHSSDLTATYATHFATSFSNFSPRKEKGYNMKIFMCYVPRSCFLSGFFFTNIHKSLHSRGKGGGGRGYLFNSSLPLPLASQTFRHQPGDYFRGFISANTQWLDSNRKPLARERKTLAMYLCIINTAFFNLYKIN